MIIRFVTKVSLRRMILNLIKFFCPFYSRVRRAFVPFDQLSKNERLWEQAGLYRYDWITLANFSYFHLELNAVVAYLAIARFYSHWRTEQISRKRSRDAWAQNGGRDLENAQSHC